MKVLRKVLLNLFEGRRCDQGFQRRQELELGADLEIGLDFARAGNWNFHLAGNLVPKHWISVVNKIKLLVLFLSPITTEYRL